MAHRRALCGGKVAVFLLGGAAAAVILAGTVFISNQVTGLRSDIAGLQDRRCCLVAGNARLQSDWNRATSPGVVKRRAMTELGLVWPERPGPVLVRGTVRPAESVPGWRKLLDGLGGGSPAVAQAVTPPARSTEHRFISLVPRTAVQRKP